MISQLTTPGYDDKDIEEFIREAFEDNLASLELEGGHKLAPDAKARALQQVLMYWRRLRDVAENVTDTEVKLSLPNQKTPHERHFTIEGIVDIVREGEQVKMYDIKTHDPDVVRANKDAYADQLNVYAHIWTQLRGQRLDETHIVCTTFPDFVRDALLRNDPADLRRALERWQPLVEVTQDETSIERTISAFGEVVDKIEEGEFEPPAVDFLKQKMPGTNKAFAVHVCRNCDARFSCSAYREYALGSRGAAEKRFRQFFDDVDEVERAERAAAGV